MGMIKTWIEHRRKIKTLKTEKGNTLNWNYIFLGILIFLCVFLIIFGVVFAININTAIFETTQTVKMGIDGAIPGIAKVFEKNPELAVLISDSYSEQMIIAEIVKQMGGSADGNFKVSETFKTERYTEKEDLTCIDKFNYFKVKLYDPNINNPYYVEAMINLEKLKDEGCKEFFNVNGTIAYKCPLNNCNILQKEREVPDGFKLENLEINHMELKK